MPKKKTFDFRLPSMAQKRLCLSSLKSDIKIASNSAQIQNHVHILLQCQLNNSACVSDFAFLSFSFF